MNTPRRTIRIEDELWTPAIEKARKEDTTVTEVIRKALATYLKAGAALVLAVLALTACSGAEGPADSPVGGRTAEVGASVPASGGETSTEPTAECWTETNWLDDVNAISSDRFAAVAFLDLLPDPSEGCTAADRASLQEAEDTADRWRERLPTITNG